MQINDEIYSILGNLGYTGSYNDRWTGYLRSLMGSGTPNDMLNKYLDAIGYSGSLTDKWNRFLGGKSFLPLPNTSLDFVNQKYAASSATSVQPKGFDELITFSRSSNATVTDSNGNIVYAPHNLLTFSEQFDNAAWTKVNSTVSANSAVAPDGASTADKIIPNTTSGDHVVTAGGITASSGLVYAFSVYAKADGYGFVRLSFGGVAGGGFTFFNLTNGTVGNTSGMLSSAIESVGNGWYRCIVTRAAGSSAGLGGDVYVTSANGQFNWSGDGTSGIFVWGAQLNVGSLQPYYPTTVKNLLGFSEAFDNAAWTKSNSFIQTNRLLWSNGLDVSPWGAGAAGGVVVTANSGISPDGSNNAFSLNDNSNTVLQGRAQAINITSSNSTYTASVFIKAGTSSIASIRLGVGGGTTVVNGEVVVNLVNGDAQWRSGVSGTSFNVTSVGNGWYRVSLTITDSASGNINSTLELRPAFATTYQNTPDVAATGTALFYGAQLVQGASAGDYQQTTSAALPVMYQAPNGTMTADKLVETTASADHSIRQPVTVISGSTYTISCYLKAAERTQASVEFFTGSTVYKVIFNLATGTYISNTGTGSYTITPVGNGWYRVSLTAVATSTTLNPFIFPASNGITNYAGDGTSGIYIWGAQLSDSASLDPYVNNPVAAPSAAAYYGPRFDYDPVTRQPRGLLIEESRTNLVVSSENISAAAWNKTGTPVLDSSIVDPSGQTGTVYYPTVSEIVQSFNGGGATTISLSFFGRKRTGSSNDIVQLEIFQQTATTVVSLNAYAFSLTGANPDGTYYKNIVRTAYPNGWFRFTCQVVANTGAGLGNFSSSCRIDIEGGPAQNYIWGIQVEVGAFSTSYIPTTTATVTRAADVAVIQGTNFSSWYKYDEGTFLSEGSSVTTQRPLIAVDDGSMNNRFQITFGSGYIPNFAAVSGGAVSADLYTSSITQGNTVRITGAYRLNDFALSANGSAVSTDISGALPVSVSTMRLGAWQSGAILNGWIRRINYYNRRLDNSQLQAITQ